MKKFAISKKSLRAFPSSLCGYLTIASEKYGVAKIEQLMAQLSSGANLAEHSPALVLRERLMAQTKASNLSKKTIEAFIIKTINAHVSDKELKFLRYTELESFPQIE